MIRTQVQLTEEQVRALKEIALQENASIADLTRNAILMTERRHRALAVVGRCRSGQADVSERHDEYLVGICSGQATLK